MKDKTIYLNKGVGKLEFGLTEDAVKEMLGAPDDEDVMEHEDGTLSRHLMYYDLGLYLSFDSEDDYTLADIELDLDDYVLDNTIRVGSSKKKLLEYLQGQGYDVQPEDVSTEEEPNQELVAIEDLGVNFWLEDEEVTSIQITPC